MSTIKSSAENLTLNADGANNDIKFQSNGSEVASIDQAGVMTATSFAGSGANLTGVGVAGISSSADATAITITSAERIGINHTTPEARLEIDGGSETGLMVRATVSGEYPAIIQSASTNTTPILSLRKSGGTETVRFSSEGGILFNGDTAAANALDDYEEGTWTPTLTASGGNASYNTQIGKYTKVGNMVTLVCELHINIIGNTATYGSISTISGAPFTPLSGSGAASAAVGYHSDLQVNVLQLTFRMDGGNAGIHNAGLTSAATTMTSSLGIYGNSSRVLFSITYLAA